MIYVCVYNIYPLVNQRNYGKSPGFFRSIHEFNGHESKSPGSPESPRSFISQPKCFAKWRIPSPQLIIFMDNPPVVYCGLFKKYL